MAKTRTTSRATGAKKKTTVARKASARSRVTKKTGARKGSTTARELIDTGRNKMFAKRRTDGTFKEMDDMSRSLSADRRRTAKTTARRRHGDEGDRRR